MNIKILERDKYIAEQITEEVVQEWINTYKQNKQRMVIKIGCSTGMGKTYWTNNVLGNLVTKNNMRLLYMSPRTELNKQQVKDTDNEVYASSFDIMSTQRLQNMLIEAEDYTRKHDCDGLVQKEDISTHDIIVVDEAHLLINDAIFNQESLLVTEWLKQQNKIIILLSGTSYNLFNVPFCEDEIAYETEDDYSMVKEVIIANSDEQLINKTNELYKKLKDNEKILVITEKILTSRGEDTELSKWSRTLPSEEVSFIFSKNSDNKFKGFKAQVGEIKDGSFDGKVLIGTKAIAEGINITDPNCKYLVQNFSDEDTHLQANGRIRNRDGITIVVRAYSNQELNGKVKALKDKYGVAIDCFGNEEKTRLVQLRFKNKMYSLPNGFYRDNKGEIQINYIEMLVVLDIINQYKYAIAHKEGHNGVLKEIYSKLKVPTDKIIDLDDIEQELTNSELIAYFEKSIEIKERFITNEQKDFLIKNCNCRDAKGRLLRTPKAINQVLDAYDIPYEIKQRKSGSVRFWIINKIN